MIALQRLFKARSDQSKARYDYIRDVTTLRVRAGALSLQNIEEIDGWMASGRPAGVAQRRGIDTPATRVQAVHRGGPNQELRAAVSPNLQTSPDQMKLKFAVELDSRWSGPRQRRT